MLSMLITDKNDTTVRKQPPMKLIVVMLYGYLWMCSVMSWAPSLRDRPAAFIMSDPAWYAAACTADWAAAAAADWADPAALLLGGLSMRTKPEGSPASITAWAAS